MDERTELDRYLFDLQGYLVIEDVLTVGEVAGLNALVDQHIEPVPADWTDAADSRKMYNVYRFGMAGGSYPSGPGFLAWGQALCALLDHPRVMEIMRFQLSDCFRLDRIFGMRMTKGMPSGMLHSD